VVASWGYAFSLHSMIPYSELQHICLPVRPLTPRKFDVRFCTLHTCGQMCDQYGLLYYLHSQFFIFLIPSALADPIPVGEITNTFYLYIAWI
jgi:hypothetical protein